MKSFYEVSRDFYMKECGMDYKEASRNAQADYDTWHHLLTGELGEDNRSHRTK